MRTIRGNSYSLRKVHVYVNVTSSGYNYKPLLTYRYLGFRYILMFATL